MPEHSPEPWRDYEKCPDMFFTADGVEYSIRTVRSPLHEDTWMGQEMRDVRRIVACVNACRHLPTEFLEEWADGLDAVGLFPAQQHAPPRKLTIQKR